jgi:PAS domain S-box-containing protein
VATILVVDDDSNTRDFFNSLLSAKGHLVLLAEHGKAALEIALRQKPDLVISDILMPIMNGYEFALSLRRQPSLKSVPLIFQTAVFPDTQTNAIAAACGVKDFIPKPTDPEEILQIVTRALKPAAAPLRRPTTDSPGRDPISILIDSVYKGGREQELTSKRLATLLALDRHMSQSNEPAALLHSAADAAREIVGADFAAAGILEPGKRELESFVVSGLDASELAELGKPALTGMLTQIALEGRVFRTSGDQKVELPLHHPRVESFVGVPVRTATRNYGMLYTCRTVAGAGFTAQDEDLLAAVAAHVGVAYENILRYQELQQRTYDLQREIERRKAAEDQYRLLVETAPTGILVSDSHGRIMTANAQAQRIFGYTREELLGREIEMLVPGDKRATHADQRREYLADPQPRPVRSAHGLYGRRKDGTIFPVEIGLGPVATNGSVLVASTVVDISERKKLEEQMRLAQRLEAVGQLAAGIAHDFNNILTAIAGNAVLALADLPKDQPARPSLEEIEKAAARAVKLVRQILVFGRQHEPKREIIALEEIIDEALKLTRSTLPPGIELHTKFRADTPLVSADSTQIHQVIVNLVTNAADAMRAHGGILEVRLEPMSVNGQLADTCTDLREGAYAALTVSDNGCGINAPALEHIFEPFFTTKPEGQGTGLGLSVVHGIVKNHGGAIVVGSEPNRGTTFTLYFPAAEGRASEERPSAPSPQLRGHGERVLYLDDEESLVLLMTRTLKRLGYEVTGCTDSSAAIETFRSHPLDFELVVSDLSMPGMSGIDFARKLLTIRPGMPILIVAGYIRDSENEEVRRLGLPDMILKPDTIEELGRTLAARLTRPGVE